MSPAGRPEIGQPINVRLGDELLAEIDAEAKRCGMSRAQILRMLLAEALNNRQPVD
jgi:antitoxin component of RelBE/YafQ-DinJ toxin-antitoxin module